MPEHNEEKVPQTLEELEYQDGAYIVRLGREITGADGEKTTELRLSEPTLELMEELEKQTGKDMAKTNWLLSQLTGIPPMILKKAVTVHLFRKKIEPVLNILMGESPEIGETK